MVVQDLLFTESLIETDEGRVLSFLPPSYLQTDNHLKLNPVIYSKPKHLGAIQRVSNTILEELEK